MTREPPSPDAPVATRAAYALEWLARRGSRRNVAGMARYGIVAKRVHGVTVADIRRLAKALGRDHALALALWKSGWFEARMLAAFVDEPSKVTPAQMDRWAKGFDNWAICDTHCMHLFDRTPHAWTRADAWTRRPEEFVKRAGFALYASLARHDGSATDARFAPALRAIERESTDDRNYVRKAANWALRCIGSRRSPALRRQARRLATRLAGAADPTARWIGKDALRDFARVAAR